MKADKKNPIRFREITPYVDVVIDGFPWRAANPLPGIGWELQSKDRPYRNRILTSEEYASLKEETRVVLVSEIQSFAALSSLTPGQRDTAYIRSFWMEVVDQALEDGELEKLSRGKIHDLIKTKADYVAGLWQKHNDETNFDHGKVRRKKKFASITPGKKAQSGDVDRDRLRPCAKTLLKLYLEWVESGRDFWKLVPNTHGHSDGGKSIDERTWTQIQQRVESYASEKNPTLRSVCERINIDIMALNAVLGEDHHIPLATEYGVAKAIDELPASVVLGGRLGKKRMVQELRHVGKGPSYKRIGEMTLHDCWSTHVFSLLSEKAQQLFNKKELEQRLVLAAVVESATGAIVGLKHGLVENAELTTAALRMAMSDKTAIAKAAGCTAPWDMRIGIEEVKSDSGGAYRSSMFMSSAYALVDRLTFTAAGRANLRGKIERIFRTMDVDFITRITGRTGSSIRSRGRDEQDPQDRASVFVDQFMKLLVRYVVDVLHYRPRSKVLLSSARQFEAISGRLQSKAAPTDDEIRVAFGIVLQRKLTRAGIRFMNIIYHSGWLDIVMAAGGPQMVAIKVDEQNLGRISVLLGQDWTTIPGPRELEGVTLDEWVAKNAELARRYGDQARLDFERFIAPALLDIERAAKRAEDYFKLENVQWTAAMIDNIETQLRVFVLYDRDPTGDEKALTKDSSLLGSVHTRSAPSTQAIAPQSPPPSNTSAAMPGHEPVARPEAPAPLKRNRPKKDRS
ncbi:Mu transposase C-terminal domain-containing protein [Devosia naphthalenivorans]|uniref:Mu transposase C-terminal domain-containing protein n=1 Tax=Devosia naphthalenivorans TaxID=2082392 RepID=UPI000D3B901D|nr:Mu transposase C-terminal domain-containing protein [Devosia naphthalenivorans]